MAMVKRAAALLIAMAMAMVKTIDGTLYKVGDSAGWTTIGNVDYKQWAATKSFKLGDVVVFEYNSQFHNVMRVTHAMYKACNSSAPLATYTSGNDTVAIKTRGHHYFFCGVPGHCQAGQKVDINVPRLREQELAPTPSDNPSTGSSSSSPTPPDSPGVPAARVLGPSANSAAGFVARFVLVVFGVFVAGFA